MPEMSQQPIKRQFDWGPASDRSVERFKEIAVYLILICLLGLCGWLLIDVEVSYDRSTGTSKSTSSTESAKVSTSSNHIIPRSAKTSQQSTGLSANVVGKLSANAGGSSNSGSLLPQSSESAAPIENDTTLSEPTATETLFYVQLGVFSDEESARLAQQRVRQKGFEAILSEPNEEYEMYRLTVGPFTNEETAEKTARQLNELDFPSFVIEGP